MYLSAEEFLEEFAIQNVRLRTTSNGWCLHMYLVYDYEHCPGLDRLIKAVRKTNIHFVVKYGREVLESGGRVKSGKMRDVLRLLEVQLLLMSSAFKKGCSYCVELQEGRYIVTMLYWDVPLWKIIHTFKCEEAAQKQADTLNLWRLKQGDNR